MANNATPAGTYNSGGTAQTVMLEFDARRRLAGEYDDATVRQVIGDE
ncbi:hypothetical protein [Halorubrum aethiopicum]|nr:hypothetical protein [Halorubrum aethiopicum]